MNINLVTYRSIFIFLRLLTLISRSPWRQWWKLKPEASLLENYSMHPVHWTVIIAPGKNFSHLTALATM